MSDIETELNTLRSIIAQQSTMLAALEQRVQASRNRIEHADAILSALSESKHLTVAQIMARCNLSKSQVWHNVWKLETEGKVWIRHTRDRKTKRRHDEIYHADAIVT